MMIAANKSKLQINDKLSEDTNGRTRGDAAKQGKAKGVQWAPAL
jgi:hypothetical protein